jgi:hypothetical protein
MKTIQNQETIDFHAITIQDAIILLPLMDRLLKNIQHNTKLDIYNNLPKEEQANYRKLWEETSFNLSNQQMCAIYALLKKLGFASQVEEKVLSIDDLELAR